MDLSVDLGFAGDFRNPEVLSTIEEIGSKIRSKSKSVGMLAITIDDYTYWRERGFQVLCCWAQMLFLTGAKELMKGITEYEDERGGSDK